MASKPRRTSIPSDYGKQSHRIKLVAALESEGLQTLKSWLDAGMDPNMNWGGVPLLIVALYQWDSGPETFDLLLERGADPNLGSPPPLFRFTDGFRLSWLLQAGADPSSTFTRKGENRPFRVESWIRKEGLESFGLDWMNEYNTFRFWRLKKTARPRPEFTKAFAIFAVKRSKSVSVHSGIPMDEIFGVTIYKLKNKALVKEAITSWLDRNFDAIDHLAKFLDKSLILRGRRSDGVWLEGPVSAELDMGESFDETLEAFKAEMESAAMDKVARVPGAAPKKRKGL